MSQARRFSSAIRDGEVVPYEELTIHAESLSMRYALSAFEGVRGYLQRDGRTVRFFALDEHLERLQRTLDAVSLPAPPVAPLAGQAMKLVEVNGAREDCYLRIAANAPSLGTLQSEAKASFFLSLQPMGRKKWLEEQRAMSIAIGPRKKPSHEVFPQWAKVISNYALPRLAYLDARRAGHDDVVLLTPDGLLAEAPTANVLLVKDGVVSTPRLEDSILPGITRRHVLGLCAALGMRGVEAPLRPADAHAADEAFLCGTGLELAPIGAFDGRPLPPRREVFSRLAESYFALVRDLPPGPGEARP